MLHTSLIENGINRRAALKAATGLGASLGAGMLGVTGAAAAEDAAAQVNFADPAQNLEAFVRLTGDLDPSVETFGWFGGRIFGVRGADPLTPMVDVEGFGVLRVAPQEDGTFRLFNRELAFYKDPKTGEFLDRWTNPYLEEEVDVVPIHNAVVNAEVAPIIKQDFDGTIVEIPFTPPWTVLGDSAFSTFELHAAFPNPMSVETWPRESAGPVNRTSEMFQRMAKLEDVNNESLTSIPYVGTWTRVSPWLPWMLMGQAEGHLLYRTFMKKSGSVDNLPEALRKRTEERYPDFLTSPGDDTWGQPNDSSFTVYMEEREPQPAKKG